ncbi:uncharacterized protein BT62DRAFT_379065 [Guyanagaster necrorhizus]|uniref:Uncharacterized protein n=1 Tax=Guyanagaster necrorhizus TaxID=856835 RepID=A0A9P7VL90_9AGAR|nr:uncharacterized protein BT62DRAFT_379065 [Guyanagaster necrorhizus MCA 3950]KAG7442628.1 hypothetical protein BT62DRAFT_379065 [Guyanagaster necrorhizus MCA 3950]
MLRKQSPSQGVVRKPKERILQTRAKWNISRMFPSSFMPMGLSFYRFNVTRSTRRADAGMIQQGHQKFDLGCALVLLSGNTLRRLSSVSAVKVWKSSWMLCSRGRRFSDPSCLNRKREVTKPSKDTAIIETSSTEQRSRRFALKDSAPCHRQPPRI